MHGHTKDTRIVYGAQCMWWGDIKDIGKRGSGDVTIPCCPHCSGVLFEMRNPEEWWKGVDEFQEKGHPGYHDFIAWLKGKCFPDRAAAKLSYERETEKQVTL